MSGLEKSRMNRTLICSVLFLDIVEYSRATVNDQILYKRRLNAVVTEALKNVAVNDRIILDTGDGAAVGFLGDPEDVLFVSLGLREAVIRSREGDEPCPGVRFGINLGPVKIVEDVNARPNIIGDGINVAQRVMSFAEPDEIFVSRSYYEVVSCLSREFSELFRFIGVRADKHVREHEIYALNSPAGSDSAGRVFSNRVGNRSAGRDPGPGGGPALPRTGVLKKALIPAAAVLALALGTVAVITLIGPAEQNTSIAKIAKTVQDSPPANGEVYGPGFGFIRLAVTPWGDVFVDGEKRGASPPLRELKLEAGTHDIEIRNSVHVPFRQSVEIRESKTVEIRHIFR